MKRIDLGRGQVLTNLRIGASLSATGQKIHGDISLSKGEKLWDDYTLNDLSGKYELTLDSEHADRFVQLTVMIAKGTYQRKDEKAKRLPECLSAVLDRTGRLRVSSVIDDLLFRPEWKKP